MTTITCKVQFTTRNRRRSLAGPNEAERQIAQPRVPRISKLMALAIRFDQLLRDGTVRDMSEMARLAHVTQPRMTQIMNLLHLAPDIQEELLMLPGTDHGHDSICEKMLRPITARTSWHAQRAMWIAVRERLRCRSALMPKLASLPQADRPVMLCPLFPKRGH